jgi:signal transduction histidine kinase
LDIKLKNRHRISALLAAAIVLAAAFVMVELYPFFENESSRNGAPAYEENAFLRYLVFGNYVLAMEDAQTEQNKILSPFQYFFPEAEAELKAESSDEKKNSAVSPDNEAFSDDGGSKTEYLRSLRKDCIREYENWNRYFGSIRNSIDYQMIGENGKVILDHSEGRLIPNNSHYVFQAVLHYDELGRMDISCVRGENTAYLLNTLQDFGDADPMESYYNEQYFSAGNLKLSNPRNVTFAYGMSEQQIAALKDKNSNIWTAYENSGSVTRIFIGLICAVGALALFFSCFDVTLPDNVALLRTPFELVAGIGAGAVAFGAGLTSLVAVTNRGDLYNALLRANFLPFVAGIMVKLWNFLWWMIPFSVIYWSILCIRDVFHIGIRRYLRERTICGLFWGWVISSLRKLYHYLGTINLQDKPDRTIFKIAAVNFIVLTILCSLWFLGVGALFLYSIILFFVMRKYYLDLSSKYNMLLKATNQIAEGDLEVVIEEDLGVFDPFKKEIQKIQSGLKGVVDEEVKSQKLKTDLISNMSHDLKTPLTAIITYVNLLKDDHATPEQRKAYIDILEQKSMRLKALIEDLFEISKANSNNVTLDLEDVDIVSLLKEVSFELCDKIEESTIDFRWNLPDEKIILSLDSQKTYRIFDNLLTNIIKYAMPGTRAYIDLKNDNGWVVIILKNISAAELTFNPEEITERFARGDQARNTEGSGLGMAIAKSFVELQNGKLNVETEADLFRVTIRWPIM